jgi:hypothetical protein
MKWMLKVLFQMVLWVFLLSIHYDGHPLFTYANKILVQNPIVQAADEELSDLWFRLSRTARMTFREPRPDDGKNM